MPSVDVLWRLARPRMLPFLLILPLLGYGWAHWEGRLVWRDQTQLAMVLLSWTALHAGTLWLNAALDGEDGTALFAQPSAVPTGLRRAGFVALAVGVAIPSVPLARLAAAAAALLAVLYSHPRTAWKGHPVLGPAVNAVGYGLLAPLAGWAAVGTSASRTTLLVWPLLAIGLLAPTFVAQAWQGEADRARGHRTLVVTHGAQACRRAARVALWLALAWGLLLAALGVVPRWCALAAPAWVGVDRWLATRPQLDAAVAQQLVVGMAAAAALTAALGVLALRL